MPALPGDGRRSGSAQRTAHVGGFRAFPICPAGNSHALKAVAARSHMGLFQRFRWQAEAQPGSFVRLLARDDEVIK